jgi:hypothetical protein
MRNARFRLHRLPKAAATLLLVLPLVSSEALADQGLLPYVTAIPRAEEGDVLRLAVFELVRYDSNFFRLADGVDPPDGSRRSAITRSTGVGLNIDKLYGLQEVTVNASIERDQYPSHGDLDYTSRRIDATYRWKFTTAVAGDIQFNDQQTPTDYEFAGFLTSASTTKQRIARLNFGLFPEGSIQPRVSLFSSETRSSVPTFQLQSSKSTGVEASIRYLSAMGNSVDVYAVKSRGTSFDIEADPVALTDPDTDDRGYGMRLILDPTSHLHGQVTVGYLKRTHHLFAVRDYGGAVGEIDLGYDFTAMTSLELTASRTLNDAQSTFSNYFIESKVEAGLKWLPTNKITVRPRFALRRQDYRGSPFPAPLLIESTRYTYLQVDWMALRALDVSFLLGRSHRTSTIDSLDFEDRNASVFARFKF